MVCVVVAVGGGGVGCVVVNLSRKKKSANLLICPSFLQVK
jgi:hypothetical protein